MLLHERLRDLLFARAPGYWSMSRCLDCGAGYLDPRPTAASIGRAYGDYYTHDHAPAATAPLNRWKLALRNGYLNGHYGYSQQPAMAVPATLLPARWRRKADRSIRHLPLPHSGSSAPRLLDLGCGNGAFLSHMQGFGWEGVGLEPDRQAVYFLLHFPSRHQAWALPSTLPYGVRTFLSGARQAHPAAIVCPTRSTGAL